MGKHKRLMSRADSGDIENDNYFWEKSVGGDDFSGLYWPDLEVKSDRELKGKEFSNKFSFEENNLMLK